MRLLNPYIVTFSFTLEDLLPESITPSSAPETREPAELATVSAPDSSQEPRRKMSKVAIGLVVATALAVAGWVGVGLATSSLTAALAVADKSLATAEGRIKTLQSETSALGTDLDKMTDSRDSFKDASDAVSALEKTVAEREVAVTGREATITAKETHIQETTLKDGMYYTVGVSMEGGTYQTTSSSSRCYWSITRSGTNYDDIVDNDLGALGVLTVSLSAGQDFQSRSCGDWVKIG